jgi:dihydroorotate dehydrogenase (NAD+) catalytic subunit
VDIRTRKPVLANGLGGFSGPAILPIALRMVWQASQAVSIPVCGIGGISSAEDAIKFLLCGASAVQVGTSNYLNPMIAGEIVDGIAAYCRDQGISHVADLVGTLDFPKR